MFQPISTFDNAQFLFRNSDVEGAEDFLFLGAEKNIKRKMI
jgi:hypothetical protein